MSSPSDARPAGVIHDIGYRPYTGPVLGGGAVARSLFWTGLRNCYGLGRSARSKVLPMMLLATMVLPAVILVGILVQLRRIGTFDEQILAYSRYAVVLQLVITIFVAAQAPNLISRDLRFKTITLYLARPLQRSTYVLVRLASLMTAVFVLIALPLLVLYVGGLLAGLSWRDETKDAAVALVGALLLSVVLSGLAALVSAVTIRRGLAVTAGIVVLLVSYTGVSAVQGVAADTGHGRVGQVAGLFSPYTLVDGLQAWAFDAPASTIAPPHGAVGWLYVAMTVVAIAGTVGGMLVRYRKAASL